MNKYLDGNNIKPLIINGVQSLVNDVKRINDLNVFPVPDGDTGTNMKLTIEGGAKEIASSNQTNLGLLFKDMAKAMVMSARGNSGVITSQFFKGLANYFEGKEKVNTKEFAKALVSGTNQAYAVVAKPQEGTILTVMKDAGNKVISNNYDSIEELLADYLKEAKESLIRTPDLLPVLKEAGVVDSGGAGFVRIVEGMLGALDGNMLASVENYVDENHNNKKNSFNADSKLEFGYCTEFILQLQNAKVDIKNFDLKVITDFLETIGNSIVAFKDDDIVKVHVHTFTPGKVVDYCQQFGEYVTFKMENMSVQHSENQEIIPTAMEKEHKENAIVAVSSGNGISSTYKSMGVDEIVSGGQTMNPSIDDFIKAFNRIDATNIYVFPNNSNIIMAAKQAAVTYNKAHVIVIPTTSMLHCYACLNYMDLESGEESVLETCNYLMESIQVCNITYAIRDCEFENIKVKKDDYMALVGKKILAASKDKLTCIKEMLSNIEDVKHKEIYTVFAGLDTNEDEVNKVKEIIKELSPFAETIVIDGKQDVYSYLISIQ